MALRTPPVFGVWLIAGVPATITTRVTATVSATTTRDRDMRPSCEKNDGMAPSVREKPTPHNLTPLRTIADASLEEPQEQVDGVERAAGETAHHGAVDANVLQVVTRVLLDEAHGALGPERADPLLDEGRDAAVVTFEELERARLH